MAKGTSDEASPQGSSALGHHLGCLLRCWGGDEGGDGERRQKKMRTREKMGRKKMKREQMVKMKNREDED